MREKNGYAVIELTHDGIPSAELKPEPFSDFQLSVINALDAKMQKLIRSGKPVIVIDTATGQKICSFNKCNFVPSQSQIDEIARGLAERMRDIMQDPEQKARYEEWKKKQPPAPRTHKKKK